MMMAGESLLPSFAFPNLNFVRMVRTQTKCLPIPSGYRGRYFRECFLYSVSVDDISS